MRETREIIFKPTYAGVAQKLAIHADYIEFYRSLTDKHPHRFAKSEICGMRFGNKALREFGLSYGRVYWVDIKHNAGRTIKVRLTSKFKLKFHEQKKNYSDIINTVFSYYFSDAVINYVRLFKHRQNFTTNNILITPEGVFLKQGEGFIAWADVESKIFKTYYALSSKSKSSLYQTFDYAEDWNVLVLYNVIKQILKLKNLLK